MERITKKTLESLVEYINKLTNSPATPYTRTDNKSVANVGNFHRMSNEGGGVSTPVGMGTRTKRELYNDLQSFIRGLEFKKNEA